MTSRLPFGKISGKKVTKPVTTHKFPQQHFLNEESGVTLHPRLNSTSRLSQEDHLQKVKLLHGEMLIDPATASDFEKYRMMKTIDKVNADRTGRNL